MTRFAFRTVLLILAFALCGCAQPYVHLDEGDVIAQWNFRQEAVRLEGEVAGAANFELVTHFLGVRDGEIYFAGTVHASSRDNEGQGQCGCGEEQTLIWFHLDRKLQTVESKTWLIESCWKNASAETIRDDSVLEIESARLISDSTDEEVTRIRFDRGHPEAGPDISVLRHN